MVALAGYDRLGLADLRAVVANERPAAARAALAQGTCEQLGLEVPVGVGADNVGRTKDAAAFAAPYARPPLRSDGGELLVAALRGAASGSVRLLLTSALTDAAWLLARYPSLCLDRLAGVTMMSGAGFDEQRRSWVPDAATNNTADMASADAVFAVLQEPEWRHVEVQVVTRWAVYRGSRVAPASLAELAAGGHPVAVWARERAEVALNRWWRSANYPPGHPDRGTLPVDRDREWFVQNFLGGSDPKGRRGEDRIFDLLPAVRLYDVVAGVAAIEPAYFEPSIREEQPHVKVIGESRETHGVRDPDDLTTRITDLLWRGFYGNRRQ